MSKQSISGKRKEIQRRIENQLHQGKSRQEILEDLSKEYFDPSTLARFVATTADQATKVRYKALNTILLGLLGITILGKLTLGASLMSQSGGTAFPLVMLLPLINIWLAVEVSKYRGYIYKILGLITIASLLQTIDKYGGEGVWLLADLGIGIAIAGLAFYLGNKMFPNYGLFGPKKDKNGDFLLE